MDSEPHGTRGIKPKLSVIDSGLAAALNGTATPILTDAVRGGQLLGRTEHFAGLRALESRLGDRFLGGTVLGLGRDNLPFGPKLRALPVSVLWDHSSNVA